jgi:DNA-binding MarR family transcriptional regulator
MSRVNLQSEIRKENPFAMPEQEAYLSIVRTATLLSGEFERLFKRYGLSEAAYNALRILRGRGEAGSTCNDLKADLVAQVPDVTRLVDRLERSGLAERCRCQADRRVIYVKITRKGLDLLAKIDRPLLELHRKQLSHMGEKRLRELNRLLVRARHPDGA